MIRLFRHMDRREWVMLLVSIIFIVIQVWLELKMPDYMSQITTLVETEGSEMRDILINGGWMLLCAVGSAGAMVFTTYFAARVSAGYGASLRSKTFRKVLGFNNEEMGRFSIASLITRTTNDITQIQFVMVMAVQSLIRAPIMMVWAIIKIAGREWQWSVATAGAVVLVVISLAVAMGLAVPKFRQVQKLTDNVNRITQENLNGIRVVRAYNAEGYQEKKFDKANNDLTGTNLFANRAMGVMMPTMTLVMSGITLAIYWIGAYLINNADMTLRLGIFSDMVVFSNYAIQVIMAFSLLGMMFLMLPRAMVAARRLNEVLDTEVRMINGEITEPDTGETGTVEFKDVSFRYPDGGGDMLHHISFTAKKGETVAIIGATGSGKSTLINLIPRFYDVSSGQVLVDGVDVRRYDTKALRNKVGYIAQRAVLFSGTVASNVSYGAEECDDNRVTEAVDIAQSTEFVSRMKGGIHAHVAQGGTNVSGGQKQRLSIARAVYKNPEIYIFDDSFSALDFKTDRVLRSVLADKTKDATKIIVAQRIGTIRDADKIIVMEDGHIAGMGTHKELMETCLAYQEIAYSQLSEEELKNA